MDKKEAFDCGWIEGNKIGKKEMLEWLEKEIKQQITEENGRSCYTRRKIFFALNNLLIKIKSKNSCG